MDSSVHGENEITSRSNSDIAINIDEQFSIDQTTLVDLVKDKNLPKLEELGGVEGICEAVNTNLENGIQSNEEDNPFRNQQNIEIEITPLRSNSEIAINIDKHFSIDQKALVDLVKDKSLSKLEELGGVEGISKALKTNSENGIQSEDIARRKEAFGSNTRPPAKSFFYFVWEASKDLTIIILIVCAALSLGFGINVNGALGSVDGLSIFISVFLVIVVSAICNYRQSQQSDTVSNINNNNNNNNIKIDVIRDGSRQQISIIEIVVGDAIFLNIGGQVPADGLLLEGHSLLVDESSMTGESEPVEVNHSQNPFLFSGTEIVDGHAKMVVTSVGMNATWEEETPLQARLEELTSIIGKIGLSVLIVLIVMATVIEDDNENEKSSPSPKVNVLVILNILGVVVMIILVAIPEGLSLVKTLTLAYVMKQMVSDNAILRKLSACETMGSARTICTHKTGTLTMNEKKVTKCWIGKASYDMIGSSSIAQNVKELFREGVAMNTTGSVFRDSKFEYSGSPTEIAILSWAVKEMDMDMDEEKKRCVKIEVEAFNSTRKRSGAMIERVADGTQWTHWKGAAEMVLAMCTEYYEDSGTSKELDNKSRDEFEGIIEGMAKSSLSCIAFAVKRTQTEPNSTRMTLDVHRLILLGIVGIEDPCCPRARKAVGDCRRAGVDVKIITGDNIFTAKAIALECGILEPDQDDTKCVIDGTKFRTLTPEERLNRVKDIRVMARSSPSDKLLMVQSLKEIDHVVAVTGKKTSDVPALKKADIGLSMGIQGTKIAKESSDIVILDDNLASVVKALGWGRCLYNNIQKLIQFNLTANAAALVINFSAVIGARKTPLSTVQLLWVNLIVDTLGVLALATEKRTNELMESPPVGRTEPLITNVMLLNLLAQATYQICVVLVFLFRGQDFLGVKKSVNYTMIFNTFVLCQVFNQLNARKLEKRNVFRGIHRNKLFMGIMAVTLVVQVLMVEFLQKIDEDTERLSWVQWSVCLGIASVTWPIGWAVKCVKRGIGLIKRFFFSNDKKNKI